MQKSVFLLLIILCLAGCKGDPTQVSLSGEIKGLTNDTLYIYGADRIYDRIDTIYAPGGKISHTLRVDTLTAAFLLINNQTEYPIFFDKGNKIKIKGNAADLKALEIEGNTPNEELTAFQKELKGLGSPSEKALQEKAETFIRQHHSSLASIYLLDKYFVQQAEPDYTKIKQLIEMLTGELQDRPYFERLNTIITQADKSRTGKFAPYFYLPNLKGVKLSRNSDKLKDKFLLLHFWASWNADSKETNAELRKLNRQYKNNKEFALVGISLDTDKAKWKETIKRDSLSWEQVRDSVGLDSETAKQFNIQILPTNLLLSRTGTILARDIKGDSLVNKLKEVLKTEEKKPGR